MFDWLSFLESRRIEYFAAGPNVARGNVNVRCPWCGAADSSAHMGISLQGKGWGCWRNQRHRGRAPEKLIGALLGISWAEAARLIQTRSGVSLPGDADFAADVDRMLGMARPMGAVDTKPNPRWPRDIVPLKDEGRGRLAYDYLCMRTGSYLTRETKQLVELYDLRFGLDGKFQDRIVIPVYDRDGLVTWTGRHIGKHPVRYRSLSADPVKAAEDNLPEARLPINSCIFNELELTTLEERWPLLVIGEGPLDAMRLDYFGYKEGMRGSCLFGLAIYDRQIETLAEICDQFEEKILLLDEDATVAALTTASRLEPLGFRTMTMVGGKDPGDMGPEAVKRLARNRELA